MPTLQNSPAAFARQLRDGHYNELRVALFFMLRGAWVRIGFDDGSYDLDVISARGRRSRVEVKWDKRAGDTGNLYFEMENTRKRAPSGYRATLADWWCHVVGDGDRAWMIPVDRLRGFLDGGRFREVSTGGVDSNSRGLLVREDELARCDGAMRVSLPTVESFFGELFRSG